MQTIGDLFKRDVTRAIPAVIYFHETDPETLQSEVDEYIVTGGYKDGDHRKQRVERGIHEEYVGLLKAIVAHLKEPGAREPASWISGFYGSGKSSFAKMLGLALDDKELPDGRTFADAWLSRDETPLRQELVDVWDELHQLITPVSVVFDIGGSAREEPLHITILRETLKRFGYATNARVAMWELEMERDAYYKEFAEAYVRLFDRPWEEGKLKRTSDMEVSAVMHEIKPEAFDEKGAWRRIYGRDAPFKLSPNEVRDAIEHILNKKAPGKTLFIVVDEMSQYIIGQNERMLHMQSFNSALGHLRGKVWLLATGQQKLEDEGKSSELGKMKDRFPSVFRVHLGEQNIREVVHKRLLAKTDAGAEVLRGLFEKNRQNLKLYAYQCEAITPEDFVEVYPLLPGHISLLLDITTQMRHRSSKMQGDSHSVRGLMQLLGELFDAKKLAEGKIGKLITFDEIYDVQETSLDVDTQRTMMKIQQWSADNADPFALQVAKVVALLQLVQEEQPTTLEFVSQCLYSEVDLGPSRKDDVKAALERLRTAKPAPLIAYSERTGYRLESSARAEWNKERDEIRVGGEQQTAAIQGCLKKLIEIPNRPRLQGVPLPYEVRYSDSRGNEDVWIRRAHGQAAAPIDLRLLADPTSSEWIRKSAEDQYKNRIVWMADDVGAVYDAARAWSKSTQMVRRYETRRDSLTPEKATLLIQEKTEEEELARKLEARVRDAFVQGSFYFRGREFDARDMGDGFGTILEHTAESVLEDLYPHFTTIQVTAGELEQLFKDSLAGASTKFTEQGLGILEKEAGQLQAKCSGTIPDQIRRAIHEPGSAGGSFLFDKFTGIPYGYSTSVIKACLLGLLRGHKIKIVPQGGGSIESYADPGTQDLFSGDRDLQKADFYPGEGGGLDPSQKVQIARLLESEFNIQVDREEPALAEAAFKNFPTRRTQLAAVTKRIYDLRLTPPPALQRLDGAINAVTASPDFLRVASMLWNKLDDLRDGFQMLNLVRQELTDEAEESVRAARGVLDREVRQLEDVGAVTQELRAAADLLADRLQQVSPWQDPGALQESIALIREAYVEVRRTNLQLLGAAVEEARTSVKLREGFAGLDADQSNHVLRPFAEVTPDTDAEALHPSLAVLQTRRSIDLNRALDESHRRLDEVLGLEPKLVVVKHGLNGKMIATQGDLEAVVDNLRKLVAERLSQGNEVRLQD